MVILHVKKNEESQFLFETSVFNLVDNVIEDITNIYNGRLKISRLCSEIDDLRVYGPILPLNMQGLTDEQIVELKLKDEYGDKCLPLGGYQSFKDPLGRRNGKQACEDTKVMLYNTINEAKALVSKKLATHAQSCLNMKAIMSTIDILRGAVTIAYPMGLPPYDPVQRELDNCEDLTGTQASLEVFEVSRTTLWFSGKEMKRGKKLSDFLGTNEKSKVIVKIQKMGQGPPGREPVMNEEDHKAFMAHMFHRQEELKKLETNIEDEFMNSPWADNNGLKKSMHGISSVTWKPK